MPRLLPAAITSNAQHYLDHTPAWQALTPVMLQRLAQHGDTQRWQAAVDALPELLPSHVGLNDTVTAQGDASAATLKQLRAALRDLHPWRKGPFELFGIAVDSEWRSDWKWQRIAPFLPPLEGRRVLDVGCGNGYYGWRMLAAGAALIVGIDPTPLFFYQHQALLRVLGLADNWVLPLRLEELDESEQFDVVFSMGVLYHRREPLQHIRDLAAQLGKRGHLVLETLVCEQQDLVPGERYARMRNVHLVPTPARVSQWLRDCGFHNTALVSINTTSTDEQRSTPWMTFESLAQALDPLDSSRTIEGHPAPVRACFVAELGSFAAR